MRAAITDSRPVPVGVNMARPLREWTLTGGAYYDAELDEIVLPMVGASATSPWSKTDHPGALRFGAEWWTPGPAKNRLINTHYADASQVRIGGNGQVRDLPAEEWVHSFFDITSSSVNRMTESVWASMNVAVTTVFGVPGTRIRHPELVVLSR